MLLVLDSLKSLKNRLKSDKGLSTMSLMPNVFNVVKVFHV